MPLIFTSGRGANLALPVPPPPDKEHKHEIVAIKASYDKEYTGILSVEIEARERFAHFVHSQRDLSFKEGAAIFAEEKCFVSLSLDSQDTFSALSVEYRLRPVGTGDWTREAAARAYGGSRPTQAVEAVEAVEAT